MHLTSPEKNSHAHSDMPKSVHMHVKNFTCIASIMHVKVEVHMHDKIVSHVWKDFKCNKMHGKKVHKYGKNVSHVLQNFTRMSKSSHACEMLMWWTCIFANIDFTWFLFFTHFSHPFHMIFTHIALVVLMDLWSTDILKSTSSLPCLSSISFSSFSSLIVKFLLPSEHFPHLHPPQRGLHSIQRFSIL